MSARGGLSALRRGGRGRGGVLLPLHVNDVTPPLPRSLPTWTCMASHATSTQSALRCSHPVTAASKMTMAAVTVPSSPIPATPVCTRQCRLTCWWANMPTGSYPAGRFEPPRITRGRRKGLRRSAWTPRASTASSHTAERYRRRPSGPGATLCCQAGSGYLAARVTRAKGGGGATWAVPKSSRDGIGISTSRPAPCPLPAPELASLWSPALRPERAEPLLRSLQSSLAARPALIPCPCACPRR